MNDLQLIIEKQEGDSNNSQSLFKLSLIFIFAYIISATIILICHINIFGVPAEHDFNRLEDAYFSIISNNIIAQFNYYLLYFTIAILMFIYGKLHRVNAHNIQLIFVIALLFAVISYLFDLSVSVGIYSDPYLYFPKSKYLEPETTPFLSGYAYSFLIIIKPLLLIGMIKVVVAIPLFNKQARLPYKLGARNSKKVVALLFTSILSVIPLLILLHFYLLVIAMLNYEHGIAFSTLLKLKLIATTLFIFEFIAFYFVIMFFVVKDCFKRGFTEIPIRLLLKAATWSYLSLFVSSIIVIMLYSFNQFIVDYFITDNLVVAMSLQFLYTSLNFIIAILLIRKVVTKYFWVEGR